MKTKHIKFIPPKLKHIVEVCDDNDKVEELIVRLNYPIWGDISVRIWKSGNDYKYYDKDAPVETRTFNSIDSLMWEYELPTSLKAFIEKL